MEFLNEYGMFLAKAATLVVAVLFVVGGIVALAGAVIRGIAGDDWISAI